MEKERKVDFYNIDKELGIENSMAVMQNITDTVRSSYL